MPEDKERLRGLARGVVLAQGNRYIKELLRAKGVRIGRTKEDFQRNLEEAIDNNDISLEAFNGWLSQVEGWGNQHVYLYRLPPTVCSSGAPWDSEAVRGVLEGRGLAHLLEADLSLSFPQQRELTGIYSRSDSLEFVWHEGNKQLIREPSRDVRKQEEEDEEYLYKAFRVISKRSVMRLFLDRELCLAAIFLQISADDPQHEKAQTEALACAGMFLGPHRLRLLDCSTITRNLDQAAVPVGHSLSSGIGAIRSKLGAGGAYVEFVSASTSTSYSDVEPIRHVRQAVETEEFRGLGGKFVLHSSKSLPLSDNIIFQIYAEESRVRLWAQCRKEDVWNVLRCLLDHA